MPVFAHAIQESDFYGNQHKGQCKCIADLACNDELLKVVVFRILNTGGF
jgi:hypothetical protein